jgi:hypothetical protein
LADVYNKIKETEVKEASNILKKESMNANAMHSWKAGFIEDAQDLHLATKSSFATIIYYWTKDDPANWKEVTDSKELGMVGAAFVDNTTGSIARYKFLKTAVETARASHSNKMIGLYQ